MSKISSMIDEIKVALATIKGPDNVVISSKNIYKGWRSKAPDGMDIFIEVENAAAVEREMYNVMNEKEYTLNLVAVFKTDADSRLDHQLMIESRITTRLLETTFVNGSLYYSDTDYNYGDKDMVIVEVKMIGRVIEYNRSP